MIVEIESATEARGSSRRRRARPTPRVAVRVNPDFEVKGSGMRMGGGPQQFGVDAEQVPALLADLAAADVDCSASTSSPAPRTSTPKSCARRSADGRPRAAARRALLDSRCAT